MAEPDDIIIGIDLGTTNSLVAFADSAGPRLIPGPAGDEDVILPSVVAFDADHRSIVGHDARAHAVERPLTTIHSIKRLMGRGFSELPDDVARLPYETMRHAQSQEQRDVVAVAVNDRLYTPPEISAIILQELKCRAERFFGRQVSRAVITVPAHFDDAQRQATRDAGKIAGLDVVRIVNEPTAAALAYGLDRREQATIAVYDLGGGTFDISILRLEGEMFEVLATDGDTHLGGDDFDHTLIDLFTSEIRDQFGVEIATPTIKQQLRTLSENIKKRLGERDSADVEIAIGHDNLYQRTMTRDEFERMIAPFVNRTITACSRAMKAARLTPDDIDQVVLVGGSTRVPLVRQRVGEVFRCRPYTAIDPDQVVAMGAAVQASILGGIRQDLLLLDVTPLALGIETLGGAMGKLIAANTRVPCRATESFTTFQDGQTSVKINVLQGERELVKDCRTLGEFELTDIPPMPAGMPKIDVTFLIDQNGILDVSAREKRSGQTASVQIVPSHGLTPDEVLRMQKEAVRHAREDMTAHHLIDVRTALEFDLAKAERMLEKFGRLIEASQRASLESEIRDLRAFAASCDDPAKINERREKFNHSTTPLAEQAVTAVLQLDEPQNAASADANGTDGRATPAATRK